MARGRDPDRLPRSLLIRAEALRATAPRRALALVRRALRGAGVEPGLRGRLERLGAHARRSLGQHAEAEAAYRRAAAAFARSGEKVEQARCAIGRIDALMYLGRHRELRTLARRARATLEANGERAAAARLTTNLANLEYRLDRPLEALRLYASARRSVGRDPVARARIDANRANCHVLRGRGDEAARLYRTARRAFARAGLGIDVAGCDYALAYLCFQRHRYAEALFALADLEDEFERIGAADYRALLDLDAAEIYLRMGRPLDADAAARAALRRTEALGLRAESARARLHGAIARASRGDLAEARRELGHAARDYRRVGHTAGAALARLAWAEIDLAAGRPRAAAGAARRAVAEFTAAGDREREGAAWLVIARAERGRTSAAATRRAAACARASRSRFLEFRIACSVGDRALARKDRPAALRAWRRAARLAASTAARVRGEMMRATDWSAWEDAHPRLIALAHETGPPTALFRALEEARAAAFERGVEGARGRPTRPNDSAREQRLESIALRLEARGRARSPGEDTVGTIGRREGELRRLARELDRLDRSHTGAVRGLLPPSSLAAVRRSLAPGSAVVEWYAAGREIAALVITRSGARTVVPGVANERVGAWIEEMRYLARGSAAGDAGAAGTLREVLAEARTQLLGQVLAAASADGAHLRELVVVPAGELLGLPWPALSPVPVSVVPTLAALAPAPADPRRREILLVGLGGDDLPAVREEIEALSRLLPRARVLLGPEATVDRVRRDVADVDWLHVCGHGHVDADRPILAGVRLADRWAHVPDLAPRGRAPRVVVLAACRTGELVGGARNQWSGLPGGLLRAGSRTFLASLWDVGDAPARRHGEALGRALAAGHTLGEAVLAARSSLGGDPIAESSGWTWGLFGDGEARLLPTRPAVDSGRESVLDSSSHASSRPEVSS